MGWIAAIVVALSVLIAGCETDPWKQDPVAGFTPLPIYCYRTIADVDCFADPVDRHRRRLVAYEGPWPGYGPRPKVPFPSALPAEP
ncbi:MAG: hypothetical protein IPM60_03240 [Rhodospirillales bacterium]|nr:hypothetical protein [Rhodospirillales bacterium]